MGDLPEPGRGERWTWRRGRFAVHPGWDGDALRARISAVGRDQDIPSDPEEAAWVDDAAARVPGVTSVWGPVWDVAPEAVGALRDALGVELETRSFRAEPGDASIVDPLVDDWTLAAYWGLPGGRVQIAAYASGIVRLDHSGRFVDELGARVGTPLTGEFASVVDVGRERARDAARSLLSWRPDDLTWVQASSTSRLDRASGSG